MDKQKEPKHQGYSDEKVNPGQLTNLDDYVTFTDKERKREEIDKSTIGGF